MSAGDVTLTDATPESRDAVMEPWQRAAQAEGWDVDADTIYWAAVDGLAWSLLEQTMDTADREPSPDSVAEARATAERILAARTPTATGDIEEVRAEFDRAVEWSLRRASAVTKRWLEPAFEQARVHLAAPSAPVVSRPEAVVKAEALRERIAQAIEAEGQEYAGYGSGRHYTEAARIARAASLASDAEEDGQ